MQEACQSLEAQIQEIEQANASVMTEIEDVVGGLSDLRQGRFAQPAGGEDMGEEVLATLKRLEAACSNSAG
jgi:centromere-localized protein 2